MPSSSPEPPPRLAPAAAAAFFLSGAAALVYQVAWQRILAIHSGVGIYSIALITAAFMTGLGLGSHWGGRISVRLAPRRAAGAFALLELAVAGFAALSPQLYYGWWYDRAPQLYAVPLQAGLLHFLALVAPTTLMGMSLPFLVRALVTDAGGASRTIGALYGCNVLGAATGAALTPWLLIRFLGLTGAIFSGVGANLAAGLLAALLYRRLPAAAPGRSGAPSHPMGLAHRGRALPLWVGLYALSGFLALSLEIVWFRLVDVGTKATAFTFGTVLAVYLLGLGAGSLAGDRILARRADPLRVFLSCQCLALLWSGLAIAAVVSLPPDLPGYRWFVEYWGLRRGFRLGTGWDLSAFARLYVVAPAALYGLPTFLMGVCFVALQRAVQDDPRTSGLKVGYLQAANIAGCAAGSLVTGLGLLSWLGCAGTLKALVAAGLVFALTGALRCRPGHLFHALGAALLAVVAVLPGQDRLWSRLHGLGGNGALVEEDATAVIALTPQPHGAWWMWMGGQSQSSLPFGGTHTLLGAIPAILHPAPRDVAIVGLGSGDTAWAAACRDETRRVVVWELSSPQQRLLRRVASRPGLESLAGLLEDPRLRFEVGDGRRALHEGDERFDLIETDALLPYVAGSGHIYSLEFFRVASRRLHRGGLMCTWAPTRRVLATFAQVFPNVVAFRNASILVGSFDRIHVTPREWIRRATSPRVRDYLGPEASSDLVQKLALPRPITPEEVAGQAPNRDLDPRDEFLRP